MIQIMRNRPWLATIAYVIVLCLGHSTHASDSPRIEIVVAEGVGRDAKAANAEACRNAVRQAVGAYVDSEQIIQNDGVISDRILSLSAGFIEKIEQVSGSEAMVDGLVRVRIRAHVRVDRLVESLGKSNIKTRSSTTSVDGASLAAQLLTKSDRVQAQGEIIDRLFAAYPARAFVSTQAGKESVERAPDGTVWLNVPIAVSPAPDWKEQFATPFVTALSADGRKSGVLTIPTEPAKYGDRAATFVDLWRFVGFGNLVDRASFQQVIDSADSKGSSASASLNGVRAFRIPEPPKALSRNGFFTLCLTGHSGGFRGTTWSWFELSEEEWKRWFAARSSCIEVTVLALDTSGDELGRDTFKLFVDWKLGDRYFNQRTQLLSPLIGVDWVGNLYFASELKLTRRVSVDEAYVDKVAAIRVSLEPVRSDK